MRKNKWFPAVLQLFADGGAAGGDAGGTAADAGQQQGDAGDVIYGKPATDAQDPAAQELPAPEQKKDRKAAFKNLIQNEWKQEADEYIQKTVTGRLKGVNGQLKAANERLDKMSPMLSFLGARYNVDPNDADALYNAVKSDKGYYAEEAMERGMDPEDLQHVRFVEAENRMMHAREDERARQAQADADVRRWTAEAQAMQAEFPGFDLETAMENEEFRKMLFDGYGMRTAFIAANNGEIVPALMEATAKDAREKTVAAIRAGMERPTENGASRSAATTFKSDPSTWSDADFDKVEEIVMRGGSVRL